MQKTVKLGHSPVTGRKVGIAMSRSVLATQKQTQISTESHD